MQAERAKPAVTISGKRGTAQRSRKVRPCPGRIAHMGAVPSTLQPPAKQKLTRPPVANAFQWLREPVAQPARAARCTENAWGAPHGHAAVDSTAGRPRRSRQCHAPHRRNTDPVLLPTHPPHVPLRAQNVLRLWCVAAATFPPRRHAATPPPAAILVIVIVVVCLAGVQHLVLLRVSGVAEDRPQDPRPPPRPFHVPHPARHLRVGLDAAAGLAIAASVAAAGAVG